MTSLGGDTVEDTVSPLSDNGDLGKIERNRRRSENPLKTELVCDNDEWDGNSNIKQAANLLMVENMDEPSSSALPASFLTGCPEVQDLSPQAQRVLKIAACLDTLDTRILQAAMNSSSSTLGATYQRQDIQAFLAEASAEGLIGQSSEGSHSFSGVCQVNVYGSIPGDEREPLHLFIGRNLVENLIDEELKQHYYLVLNQFHRARGGITSSQERTVVASLCLKAGEASVMMGEFHAACRYLEFGVELLDANNDSWRDEYELALALHNASCEAMYCTGEYEKMDAKVAQVLENATTYGDTMRARATRIYSLGSRYQMVDALNEGLNVLKHLGESFPKHPKQRHIAIEFRKTKRMLRGKTNAMILRMPFMENPDKLAAVQMLNVMYANAFKTSAVLFVLIMLRLVQLTMRYGIANGVSSIGFAYYGLIVCTISKHKEQGRRFGDLALALLDKFPGREWIPRVYVAVYGEASSYKLHTRELYSPLLDAHRIGLETGDIERAVIASNLYLAYMIFSGDDLVKIRQEAEAFLEIAIARKQDNSLRLMRPTLQLANTLTGIDVESFNLNSDLASAEEAHDIAVICIIHFSRVIPAYIFRDFETAAKEAEGMKPFLGHPYVHPGLSCFPTFYALANLAVIDSYNRHQRKKLIARVQQIVKLLKTFSMYSPENCLGKAFLLQAEVAAVSHQYRAAWRYYVSAISVAAEFDDGMVQAVACERAAEFMQGRGDLSIASRYFRKAYFAYQKWGASAKVQRMENEMPEVLSQQ